MFRNRKIKSNNLIPLRLLSNQILKKYANDKMLAPKKGKKRNKIKQT